MGTANIADGKPWPAQSQPPTPRQTEGSGAAPGADAAPRSVQRNQPPRFQGRPEGRGCDHSENLITKTPGGREAG